MANASHGWLAAAACHNVNGPEGAAARHALPPQHRGEFARFAAVALASSAFFIGVGVVLRPIQGRSLAQNSAVSPTALAPVAPGLAIASAIAPVRPSIDPRAHTALSRPRLLARTRPPLRDAASDPDGSEGLAFARVPGRVSRLLVGDGRYPIHPFPRVHTTTPE